jgi:hypothetical protein
MTNREVSSWPKITNLTKAESRPLLKQDRIYRRQVVCFTPSFGPDFRIRWTPAVYPFVWTGCISQERVLQDIGSR